MDYTDIELDLAMMSLAGQYMCNNCKGKFAKDEMTPSNDGIGILCTKFMDIETKKSVPDMILCATCYTSSQAIKHIYRMQSGLAKSVLLNNE